MTDLMGDLLAVNAESIDRFGTDRPELADTVPAQLRDKVIRQRAKVDASSTDPDAHAVHVAALTKGLRVVLKRLNPTPAELGSLKLADMHQRQRRNRHPYLLGKIDGYWLMLIDRHDPKPGEPKATLFIRPVSTAGTYNKPLPPVWCEKSGKWIGPTHEDYPGFYDDTEAAVADLENASACVNCGKPVTRIGDHQGLRNAFGDMVHLSCPKPDTTS